MHNCNTLSLVGMSINMIYKLPFCPILSICGLATNVPLHGCRNDFTYQAFACDELGKKQRYKGLFHTTKVSYRLSETHTFWGVHIMWECFYENRHHHKNYTNYSCTSMALNDKDGIYMWYYSQTLNRFFPSTFLVIDLSCL